MTEANPMHELEHAENLYQEGQPALALEAAITAAQQGGEHTARAARMAADLCIELGRVHEALSWAAEIRAAGGATPTADRIEVVALLQDNRVSDARPALERLRHVEDAALRPSDAWFAVQEARVALAVDDPRAALMQLRPALDDPQLPAAGWRLLSQIAKTDTDLSSITERLGRLSGKELGMLVEGDIDGVDRLLDTMWTTGHGTALVIAALKFVGSQLPLPRALEWSQRLRQCGESEDCPVLGIAADQRWSAPLRVRAAAAAHAAFDDERAEALLTVAAASLVVAEIANSYHEVLELADELVEAFVVGVAQNVRGALVMAEVLSGPRTASFGVGLIEHALTLAKDETVRWHALRIDVTAREQLRQAAAQEGSAEVARVLTNASLDQ